MCTRVTFSVPPEADAFVLCPSGHPGINSLDDGSTSVSFGGHPGSTVNRPVGTAGVSWFVVVGLLMSACESPPPAREAPPPPAARRPLVWERPEPEPAVDPLAIYDDDYADLVGDCVNSCGHPASHCGTVCQGRCQWMMERLDADYGLEGRRALLSSRYADPESARKIEGAYAAAMEGEGFRPNMRRATRRRLQRAR